MPRSKTMGLVGALMISLFGSLLVAIAYESTSVFAQTQTQQGDVSLNVIVTGSPPTTPAVITFPINGTHVTTTPLVVSGTCQPNLEVRVHNNKALAGTSLCGADGTFVINIGLLVGRNELTVNNYDVFERPGPVSDTVVVFVDYHEPQVTFQPAVVDSGQASNDGSQVPRGTPASFREQVANSVKRLLGVGSSEGPTSMPQTIAALTIIGGLAFYATDLLLFEATLSSRFVVRLKMLKTLIFK